VVAVEQQWAVVTLGTCNESGGGHAAGCECVVAVEQQWAVVTLGTCSESGGGHAAGCECVVAVEQWAVTLAFWPHVFLQKNDMQLLVITSAAVNRFSEFVDWQIPKKL